MLNVNQWNEPAGLNTMWVQCKLILLICFALPSTSFKLPRSLVCTIFRQYQSHCSKSFILGHLLILWVNRWDKPADCNKGDVCCLITEACSVGCFSTVRSNSHRNLPNFCTGVPLVYYPILARVYCALFIITKILLIIIKVVLMVRLLRLCEIWWYSIILLFYI